MAVVEYIAQPRFTLGLPKRIIDGKPYKPPLTRFDDMGRFRIDDEDDETKDHIFCLDNDKRYGKEYRRLTDTEINAVADISMEPVAHKPAGSIEPDVIDKIKYLEDKLDKERLMPAEMTKTRGTIEEVFRLFDIHGVSRLTDTSSLRAVKSVIMITLDLLEGLGVYPEKQTTA